MKKIKALLSLLFILSFSICLVGCNKKTEKEETIMNISCNPSVEFILDKNNIVLSVSALNEDGNVIIIDENFVGLTAQEAAKEFARVAKETGFLINGLLNSNQNTIEISFSGDTTKAKKIYDNVKNELKTYLNSNNIIATIKQGSQLTLKYIKNLVKKNYNHLTNEQINSLSQSELINYLKQARDETKNFYSQGLKDAYIAIKEQNATDIKNEKILEIVIQFMTNHAEDVNNYLDTINVIESAKTILKNARYTYLISEESIYQTKLQELSSAKAKLIQKKNEVAVMEEGPLKEDAKLSIALLENALTAAENAYNAQYEIIDSTINTAITSLNQLQIALDILIATLPKDIKTAISNKNQELEEFYNTAKENILSNFTKSYNQEIRQIRDFVANRKVELEITMLNILADQ